MGAEGDDLDARIMLGTQRWMLVALGSVGVVSFRRRGVQWGMGVGS